MPNRICELFGITTPIIQAGMVWCSGWKLASAVSNTGALGIIGAGSMSPETLLTHIQKYKVASSKPFAVNLPLLYQHTEEHIQTIIRENVPIVFTSAGNPKTWTQTLQQEGITVVHVVSSTKFALKAQEAGVDAIVAEGFEAGGHNGREETTTLCLIPDVVKTVDIPVIAAGGIASGQSMLAAFALGAEAVQVGSRFAIAKESSAHINFKQKVITTKEGETKLVLKQLTPVRLIKNQLYHQLDTAETQGKSKEELLAILGKGKSKTGIFEGDIENGELEIGQISACLTRSQTAKEIVREIWKEFNKTKQYLSSS